MIFVLLLDILAWFVILWVCELDKYTCGTAFFTRVPTHQRDSLLFGEKLVLEKLESPLILFYFWKENKTRKKTLKK